MKKIRLYLNICFMGVNVLFDPETGARMTLSKPYCEVERLSKSLERAIAAGKVIDIDKVTGIEVKPNIELLHEKLLMIAKIDRNVEGSTVEAKEEVVETKEEVVEAKEAKPSQKKASKKKEVSK